MTWTTLIDIAALLLIFVTALPLLKNLHWTVRIFEFPRLQITFLLMVVIALSLLILKPHSTINLIILTSLIVACGYQLAWILPYSPLYSCEVKKAQTSNSEFSITLLSSNVLMSNRNSEALRGLIELHQPDIIVTLETNDWWQEQLAPIEKDYPHIIACPLDNLYGMHVYSKIELVNSEIKYLVEDDKPSIHAAIELPDGTRARLHFLHPAPPSPTENEYSKERDAELLVLAETLKDVKDPIIVAGDLNDVAWSRTTKAFRIISGLLDPRVGRGTFNTFHTGYWFLRWPLDHLFISRHFKLQSLQRLGDIGSDHFPLLSTLQYTPKAATPQSSKEEQKEEQEEWAQERIKNEGVAVEDVPDPAT